MIYVDKEAVRESDFVSLLETTKTYVNKEFTKGASNAINGVAFEGIVLRQAGKKLLSLTAIKQGFLKFYSIYTVVQKK